MSKAYISADIRRRVAKTARFRCGYCLSPQQIVGFPMHVEHIIPEAVGGSSEEDNLWLACPLCNGYKGTKTHEIDPETGMEVQLFNPRVQIWKEHFAWSTDGTKIIGQSPTGRAQSMGTGGITST